MKTKLLGMALFVTLLAVCNVHLLTGNESALAFYPQAVLRGEVWRLFTYAWAHLSLYHLVLDGAATLLLFQMTNGTFRQRLLWFQLCSLSSVLLTWAIDPRMNELGLAGLSGAAHGLWVITSVQSFRSKSSTERVIGLAAAVGVTLKATIETITGFGLFGGMHFGNVGTPIAACHLGGILAGWTIALAMNGSASERRGKPYGQQETSIGPVALTWRAIQR